jgi:hypothetical protein
MVSQGTGTRQITVSWPLIIHPSDALVGTDWCTVAQIYQHEVSDKDTKKGVIPNVIYPREGWPLYLTGALKPQRSKPKASIYQCCNGV